MLQHRGRCGSPDGKSREIKRWNQSCGIPDLWSVWDPHKTKHTANSHLMSFPRNIDLENIVYHVFRQLWLVLGVKLMEINSIVFSRYIYSNVPNVLTIQLWLASPVNKVTMYLLISSDNVKKQVNFKYQNRNLQQLKPSRVITTHWYHLLIFLNIYQENRKDRSRHEKKKYETQQRKQIFINPLTHPCWMYCLKLSIYALPHIEWSKEKLLYSWFNGQYPHFHLVSWIIHIIMVGLTPLTQSIIPGFNTILFRLHPLI